MVSGTCATPQAVSVMGIAPYGLMAYRSLVGYLAKEFRAIVCSLPSKGADAMNNDITDGELLLPDEILQKARVYGREYAWSADDIEPTIRAAASLGLANLGGEAQFRFPNNALYDMYWHVFGTEDRFPDELWDDYVNRSAEEILVAFRNLYAAEDFSKDAQEIAYLFEKYDIAMEDALEYLYFQMSVITESKYNYLMNKK